MCFLLNEPNDNICINAFIDISCLGSHFYNALNLSIRVLHEDSSDNAAHCPTNSLTHDMALKGDVDEKPCYMLMPPFIDLVRRAKALKGQPSDVRAPSSAPCGLFTKDNPPKPLSSHSIPQTSVNEYFAMSLRDAVLHLFPNYDYSNVEVDVQVHKLESVASLYYAPLFLSVEEQAAVTWLMDMAPAHKWTILSARSLQVWGGTVTAGGGLQHEHAPMWMHDLWKRCADAGIVFPPTPQEQALETSTLGNNTTSPATNLGHEDEDVLTKSCIKSLGDSEVVGSVIGTITPTGWTSNGPQPILGQCNHTLFNRYERGQGIMPHTDGHAYAPVAAIVSLQNGIQLSFWRDQASARKGREAAVASVYLQPGSLVVFCEDLYGEYVHGIEELEVDYIGADCVNTALAGVKEGDVLPRGARLSLTMRRVAPVFYPIVANENKTDGG